MSRIMIDGYVLCYPRTGVVNYVYNTIYELYRRRAFDLTVLLESPNFNDPLIASFITSSIRMQLVEAARPSGMIGRNLDRLRSRNLTVRLSTSREVDRAVKGQDVYHATDWYHYPASSARVNIMTYFDLTTTLFPQYHEKTNIVKEKRKAQAARNFDRIISISESTKRDLIDQFKLPPEKIVVSYPGVDPIYDKPACAERTSVLEKYKIDPSRRYILSVCTIEPRKNIIGILEAYKVLCAMRREYGEVMLVLSGFPGWRNDALRSYMSSYEHRENVIFTGFADLADMPSLYSNAEVFIYLSFYEGLGMPLIEAMKSGCPVVCSNTSSLPEVIGDCGELVSPNDAEEAAHALARILDDRIYANSLRFAGLLRGQQFTWGKHVDDLIRLYREA